jgi:hypothetical protein
MLSVLPMVRCPISGARLLLESSKVEGDHVMEGTLRAEGRSGAGRSSRSI